MDRSRETGKGRDGELQETHFDYFFLITTSENCASFKKPWIEKTEAKAEKNDQRKKADNARLTGQTCTKTE